MANAVGRRRRSAFSAGLATMAMAIGLAAIPAEAAPPPRVDYVAVGDSYTAGTGAGPFASPPPPPPCLQSHPGYVDVVGATGRVTVIANAACHGALLNSTAPGGVPSISQQITETSGALAGAELVSLTAGANDVGFSAVLYACAYQSQAACDYALQQSAAALQPLRQGLAATYWTLHQAAPAAKIAVLGYPRLFDPAVVVPGLDPAAVVKLNLATDALNAAISGAVSDANVGAQFIDVTRRFTGHAANSLDPWIVLDLDNPFSPQNFHPNVAGHSLGYAAALISAVKPARLISR